MEIRFRTLHLNKRYPLRISRGTSTGSDNLYVGLSQDGITGWGEMSPGISESAATPQIGEDALKAFWDPCFGDLAIHEVWNKARRAGVPPCALAALDVALWDWFGKKCGQALYRIFGLSKKVVPTSVTIGINPPEVVKERVPEILERTGSKFLKIKLGSPEGCEADKAMFSAVQEAVADRGDLALRIDANGGWSPDEATTMMKWLAARGVEYVEQPLKEGEEGHLPKLFAKRPLPIYVDESCRFAEDIPNWVDSVDGVNLKLMKCGGLSEALRIVATARAHRVKVMIGCMSESTLSISAGAAIGSLFDAIDLDSQLNITNDPCSGAQLIDGRVVPNDLPGHGAVFLNPEEEPHA